MIETVYFLCDKSSRLFEGHATGQFLVGNHPQMLPSSRFVFGIGFLKSYAAVCMEGAVIILACIIFTKFAGSPPAVDGDAAPAAMVWKYVGELVFNMLVLVGAVKMSDRISRELLGLG